MDEQDRKILHILARDAKTTNAQLAEVVGLSLSACQRRVKSLEEAGAIAGYRAIIDPIHLDEAFVVFVGIRLQRHSRKIIQTFQEAIVVLDEVREVHHIAGSFDYFLRVAVKDIRAYENFHADKLAAVDGIAQITSFIAMSTFKQ